MIEDPVGGLRRTLLEKRRALARASLGNRRSAPGQFAPITPRQDHGPAPLSFAQERLWFLDRWNPGSSAYNSSMTFRIHGALHLAALQASLEALIERHEVLRSCFPLVDGQPVQVIRDATSLSLPVVDLSGLPDNERLPEAQRRGMAAIALPFDLDTGPLIRPSVLRLGPEEHILIVILHHIVTDAWSNAVFTREFVALYQAFCEGLPNPLSPLPIQYADFAVWQRRALNDAALDRLLAYWRPKLAGAPALLELPADRARPPVQSYQGARLACTLPSELGERLDAIGKASHATLFMTLLASFQVLLYRVSGQDDLVVGTPIANRTRPEVEGLIGFFLNTVALRTDLSGDPSFVELLGRVRESALGAYAHHDLPFEKLVEELQPERSPGLTPIFQVMFGYQSHEGARQELSGLTIEQVDMERTVAKHDLSLSIVRTPWGLDVCLDYTTDLFDAERMERLLGHFRTLLEGIAADPNQRISRLPILTDAERQQLLIEWNTTSADYPRERCFHELFEEQVERTPDAVAVAFEENTLTYRQLNARANQLAHSLRELGVGPEVFVGLALDRSLEMVVGILGTLKAGGAYVPLDPSYPLDRLAFMLEDAQPSVLLSRAACVDALPSYPLPVLCLDMDWPLMGTQSEANLTAGTTSDNAAYVIYTSGSTGRPKGAVIRQGGLTNYLSWCCQAYHVAEGNGSPMHSSLSFDLTITSLMPALLSGRTVWLVSESDGVEGLANALHNVSDLGLVKLTPAHLELLSRELTPEEAPGRTRRFIVGGEALLPDQVSFWSRWAPDTRIVNEYGPTETVVGCCVYECRPGISIYPSTGVPIGRPIANTRLYVLDAQMAPVPIGTYGELYIGGDGLARGYLNRPELTAEKFVADPFSAEPGSRLYRTGDVCRYLSDGNLEFRGRADQQVKVRGFRIELGEIESVLLGHRGVREAVVVAREDVPGDKRLVAYITVDTQTAPSVAALQSYLKATLPEYMVPSAFAVLEALPLTPNGKVDRKALPAPDGESAGSSAFVGLRTPLEEGIAEIWREVMRIEQVGVHDDFFVLGGHSLLATQVLSRIRNTFAVELPLQALFAAPTIAGLAARIAASSEEEAGAPPLVRVSREGRLPLSFAQQRLWFIDQLEPDSSVYNIPGALRLTGSLDVAALEQSLLEIVGRHEALRTIFAIVEGEPFQVIHEAVAVPLPVVDLSSVAGPEREAQARRLIQAEAQRPFDLSVGPLFRFGLLRLQEEEHILLLTLHHIVSDGWSHGALRRELSSLYNAFSSGAASPLPPLPIQYADYAAWQRNWLQGDQLQRQLSYWEERLRGVPPLLELPTDHPRPPIETFQGARTRREFSGELTAGLKALGQREGTTLFMTLLAAFQTLLWRYSGQEDIVVGTPIANRTRAEVEGLIGFFVNTLVLRGDLSGDPSFVELLQRVREVCLGGYAHQDLPFEKLVEELQPQRSLSHSPLFQVMFSFQNVLRGGLGLEGLGVEGMDAQGVTAKFDLSMILSENNGNLGGVFEYNTDLFDADRIERMMGHWQVLLAGIVADPEQKVSRLPLLTEPERQQLLVEWNAVPADNAGHPCVHQLFEAQVARTPEAIAVTFAGTSLTYQELNMRANRLAHYLRQRGARPDVLVGLYVERSLEMVVGMLGILKAGSAYVPLDPAYPSERLSQMILDSRTSLLLTQQALKADIPAQSSAIVCLDEDWERIALQPSDNPISGVGYDNLVYVIYTSGSTGKPKGTAVYHGGFSNLVEWFITEFAFAATDRTLMLTSVSFDLTQKNVFGVLSVGGQLHLAPTGIYDPKLVASAIATSAVTHLNCTPSHFYPLVAEASETSYARLTSLRYVYLGGEAIDLAYLRDWLGHACCHAQLVNSYGPTECSDVSTFYTMPRSLPPADQTLPIGRPIPNVTHYVLDKHQHPVPVGVPGELYIGGAGVGLGYLGRPDLTAEKFLPDPFSIQPGARFYRTGDLVHCQPDGNIAFVGRIDHQVKVRGFRIELGEIESVLLEHGAVRDAVVVAREDEPGDKRLAAYVVTDRAALADLEELRDTEAEQTTQWQAVFDARFGAPNPEEDVLFNTQGWISSFTDLPIPSHEMHEWVDQTAASILALRPQRLVEIGCGTGLLLFQTAPHCIEYIATDFSAEALRYVERALLQTQIPASRVKLQQKMADEFAECGSEAPDTVVVNSVVQYFPSIDYLLEVLDRAVAALTQGGRIFLGDLRSLTLLEEFQSAVELHHASDATDRQRMWQRVQQAVAEEDELLIDPAFFYALRERLPQITRVEVQLKRGRYWNEMSQFRYDVVLHVGPEQAPSVEIMWQDWQAEGMSLASLDRLLQQQPDLVALTAVPNARVAEAIQARELIGQTQGPQTAAAIRAAAETLHRPAVDPEEMWELGASYGYSVRICPSGPWHRGCMDVVLCSPSSGDAGNVVYPGHPIKPLSSYANDPVRGKLVATFVPQLRRYVVERLPEYMVPSSITLLDVLPLTPNGKVDRKALPSPDLARPDVNQDYEAPQTEVERDLATLWAEVLRLERVGRHHNFFELGGHSLIATQVISRIRDTFAVELPLRALFESPTIAGLAALIGATSGEERSGAPPLVRVSREGRLPLSFAQQRLWFFDQLEPDSSMYNAPSALCLTGSLNVAALEHSLVEIVGRHEALRTTFTMEEGVPSQVIHEGVAVPLSVVDLSSMAGQEREAHARRLMQEEAQRPFDLQQGPLFRFGLLRLQEEEHILLLTLHHIVSDEWSQGVLTRELTTLYRAFSSGTELPLPALPLQYADYAAWQRNWLQGDQLQRQLSYWKERLRGVPALLELPTDRPRPPIQTFRGARMRWEFSGELTAGLKALSQREGTTLFMTLLAAFQTLLYRYSSQEDIVVGTPIANRTRAEVEGLIGFFVNTLVLRGDLSGHPSFVELLGRVREVCLGAYAHQDLPFEKLVEELQPQRSLSHSPLFQILFSLQNAPRGGLGLEGLGIQRIGAQGVSAKFDLSLVLWEVSGKLDGVFEYNTDLFDADRIEQMLGHLEVLLEGIVLDPQQKVSRLPLLTSPERQQLLVDWNDTALEYPRDRCIHELFEQQVQRTPGALALVFDDQRLTYADLNARANQLAHTLHQQGVGPEVLVGLCVERSIEMVVGMLGILKAGGAYVPLDPSYPPERLQFMIQDARATLLLTESRWLPLLPDQGAQRLCLDSEWERISNEPETAPALDVSVEHPAYVIYTSGSTGQPKGVVVTHRGLANIAANQQRTLGIGSGERIVQFASMSFDACVFDLVMALCSGSTLYLGSREALLPGASLTQFLCHHAITAATLPPTALGALQPEEIPSLRVLSVAGEACPAELAARWSSVCRFFNLYGPTEATIWASYQEVEAGSRSVSIGRPIGNTRVYVLDDRGGPVPVGVAGELYLGGMDLARGYLNRADLTAEKFVPDAFSGEWGSRLYRTGDLVRYLWDGQLEFLGRIDHQVKVRGFRIELGEIESILTQLSGVREAVVLAREDEPGEKRLVAYLVGEGVEEVGALRDYLAEKLPSYMIPSAFVTLEVLPLLPNGKVDRKALPAPDTSRPDLSMGYTPPGTPVEQALATIWCEVLRLEQVGIHDNFFELGGDSILSIQIIARANAAGLRLTPRQVFQHQTIAGLASVAGTQAALQSEQGVVTGPVPLTPIQHWFFEQERVEAHHFNQSRLLTLQERVSPEIVGRVASALVSHHDALRLRFVGAAEGWEQSNAAEETNDFFSVVDLSDTAPADQSVAITAACARLQASLNLEEGPLLRVCYFELGAEEPARLFMAIHHLEVDGVSWRVLLEDLATGIDQSMRGEGISLPAKTTSFQAWSHRLSEYAGSATALSELGYWQRVSEAGGARLPMDYVGDVNTVASERVVRVSLDEEETRTLLSEVPSVYHTQINDALLTALARSVCGWTGARGVLVDLEGHGREALFEDADVSRTVGWFTSLYPVWLELASSTDWGASLKGVKEALRGVPQRGIGYGLLRYLSSGTGVRESLSGGTVPQISFNYVGQFSTDQNDSGLLGAARESGGPIHSPLAFRTHVLGINGHVTQGRLHLAFLYSEAVHTRSTVEGLAQSYLQALRELIAHCQSEDAGGYTPSDFPKARLSQQALDRLLVSVGPSKADPIEDIYPLAPMQAGMLFHCLYATEQAVYLDQQLYSLHGDIERRAFEGAWQVVIQRHSLLRTSFHWEGLEEPVQVVHRSAEAPLDYRDWTQLDAEEQQKSLAALRKQDREKGIDLCSAPLMRLTLIRTGTHTWRFLWTVHHLILDRWSGALLMAELTSAYEALRHEQPIELPALRPYGDYIGWLQEQDQQRAESYWRRVLQGFTSPTALPIDASPGTMAGGHMPESLTVRLSEKASSALQALTRQHHLTLNTLVQGAWALLLSRYSGEDDVLFGATVSGRPPSLSGVESMVGMFINSLPVRVRLSAQALLVEWLQELQEAMLELREYEYSSLAQIQSWSDVPRGIPLFDSLVIVQNTPVAQRRQGSGSANGLGSELNFGTVRSDSSADFPLYLTALSDRQVRLALNYDTSRYHRDDIQRMLGHLTVLLEAMIADPHSSLDRLPMLTEVERHRALVAWNEPASEEPPRRCVHQLFEDQVQRTPGAVAIEFDAQTLTYHELNVRANQLAHFLQTRGAGPNVLVGLCAERSIEMIVGILAILKAGSAYIPLDPTYPPERLARMIQDAHAPLLLTLQPLKAALPASAAEVIGLDADWPKIAGQPAHNPISGVSLDDLVYVIYTSGSTGMPKGTGVYHRGFSNLVEWFRKEFAFRASDRSLLVTSISFDLTQKNLYAVLSVGGVLHLAPAGFYDPEVIAERIESCGITHLNCTPSHFYPLVSESSERSYERLASLRYVYLGGEPIDIERLEIWLGHRLCAAQLVNTYGPTECSDIATYFTRSGSRPDVAQTLPIGCAIPNVRVTILDRYQSPAPVGVPGEIYIGGVGVGYGYLGHSEMTAEKFVPDPFSMEAGSRLYRTGDLGRYLADGNIVYMGRLDHQVKVRGFRIELGEIESVLRQHASIREAAVVAREEEPGNARLVAYVVGDAGVSAGVLREHLNRQLPEYMLPSVFVMLETLPLTPNGKVDRKVLPAPEVTWQEETYAAPRTPIEEGLAEIWGEVLRVGQVGSHDSFFELGGHSLLATQVMSRVRATFRVEVPLRALFEAPTIAELALRIEAARGTEVASAPPLVRVSREGRLPLSFSQQRLWFLNQYEPESALYNMPTALRLVGVLDVAALEQSLAELVQRHESLRTTFATADDVPIQVIQSEPSGPLKTVDLGTLSRDERAAESLRLIQEEYQRPFDLEQGPLFRSLLIRLDDEEHVLVLTMHHIVSDGWSMSVLRNELATLYNALRAGRPSPLQELPIQYADYAAWQREWLHGEVLQEQISYWKERFAGAPTLLELPTDRPRPPVRTFRGAMQRLDLSADLTDGIKAMGRQEGTTLFMTLLAAFQTLLCRYSGQEDVVVGTPIANRTRTEVEGLIGLFLNTLALRTDLSGDPSFVELLGRVRESALGAYAHQDLPFEKLVEEFTSERSLSYSPLFQVLFTFHNTPRGGLDLEGLGIEAMRTEGVSAKFDLSLAIQLSANGLRLGLEHNTDLFDEARIERLLHHYRTLLEGIVADPQQRLSDLPLLTASERRQVLVDWNDTVCPFPDRRLHQLVEDQVDRSPDAPALWFEGTSLSYRELDERANRLAHHLQALGVGPAAFVGVALERSVELVVALLAVLKAGAAYLPIDVDYPSARIASMLQQAHVEVILSRETEAARLPEHPAQVVCLDLDAERIASRSPARLDLLLDAQAPAYLIYTSGSTGKPKGVVVPHRAILNHMEWMAREFPLTEQDRVPLKTPIGFDASVWECWGPLMAGAQLVVARPAGHTDPAYLVELIQKQRISTIKLVPSLLQMLLEEDAFAGCESLRQIFCGAEALSRDLQERFLAQFGDRVALHNLYGPTEAAIDATGFTCRSDWDRATVPIGRPIANVQAYVLDRRLNPVPVGVPGELYLGGANLATGYVGSAELTAERFVPDPFGRNSGERLYRTGDLVRSLSDGNLEYLGRIDQQVKVRGFRIELGEIESVLLSHPKVREAVVVAREDVPGDTRLVAYLVAQNESLDVSALREHLLGQLPVYMLPSAFVELSALPLTSSGKLDRRSLPAPEAEVGMGRSQVEARTPIEEGIAQIWCEVLGLDWVGVTQSFFELGGHSLLATQVISRVRNTFQVNVPLRTLFEAPTVAGLAEHIDALYRAGEGLLVPPLTRTPRDGDLPVSFSQQRLWFIDQLDPGSSLYNVPSALRLRGALDLGALQCALQEIFTRHEVLRTRYATKSGNPIQVISEETHFPLPLLDLSELAEEERLEEARRLCREAAARPFDLAYDPMMRAQVLRLGPQDHLLLLTLHHIASDGWSKSILMRELSALYNAFAAGQPSPLSELPVQYADYAAWQRGWLQGEALQHQVDYWQSQLSGAPPVLDLPTDRPRANATSYEGAAHGFRAPSELSEALRKLCREGRATPFMVLLAAFQVLLYRWTGQPDLVVGTDVANRTQPRTEGLIGFFLNHLVLRTDLGGNPSFRELLGRVREVCLGAYAHQDLPFDKLVEVLQPERRMSHTPIFQVLFVVQNVPHGVTEWSGLEVGGIGGELATSKFDLSLFVGERGGGFGGAWVYRTDLFEASSIRRVSDQYLGVLGQVLGNPDMAIEDVELVSEAEQRQEQETERFGAAGVREARRRTAVVLSSSEEG